MNQNKKCLLQLTVTYIKNVQQNQQTGYFGLLALSDQATRLFIFIFTLMCVKIQNKLHIASYYLLCNNTQLINVSLINVEFNLNQNTLAVTK